MASAGDRHIFLLCGSTGAGKSTTGNIASGTTAFAVGHGADSMTKTSSAVDFDIVGPDGRVHPTTIVDLIGFGDSEMGEAEQVAAVSTFRDLAPGGVSGILYVKDWGRLSQSQQEAVKLFVEIMGPQQAQHTVLVLTKCKQSSSEFYEQEVTQGRSWPAYLPFFQGGRIYIDNVEQPEAARAKLHGVILEVLAKTGGRKLSNAGLNEALAYRQEKQRTISQLPSDLQRGPLDRLRDLQRGSCSRNDLEISIHQQQQVEAGRQHAKRCLDTANNEVVRRTEVAKQAEAKAAQAGKDCKLAKEETAIEAGRRALAEGINTELKGELTVAKKDAEDSQQRAEQADRDAEAARRKASAERKSADDARAKVKRLETAVQKSKEAAKKSEDSLSTWKVVGAIAGGVSTAVATVATGGAYGLAQGTLAAATLVTSTTGAATTCAIVEANGRGAVDDQKQAVKDAEDELNRNK